MTVFSVGRARSNPHNLLSDLIGGKNKIDAPGCYRARGKWGRKWVQPELGELFLKTRGLKTRGRTELGDSSLGVPAPSIRSG